MAQDNACLTPAFMGSYVFLVDGQENDDGKLVYSLCAVFDPKDCPGFDPTDPKSVPDWAKSAVAAAVATGKQKKWDGKVPNKLKMPFLDGDDSDKPELEGKVFVNLKAYKVRPPIVGPNGKAIIATDEAIYSGAKYRAQIQFAPFDFKGNRGIGAYIVAIQKVADGERLGGGISEAQAEGIFGAVEGEDAFAEEDFEL